MIRKEILVIILLIAAACSVCFCVRMMRPADVKRCDTIYTSYVFHDTVLAAPETIRVVKTLYHPVPAVVDTAMILSEFFAERRYRDTIVSMPNLSVTLSETASQNFIYDRKIDVHYREVYKLVQPANRIVLGAAVGVHPYIEGVYFRNRLGYGAGYDFASKSPFVTFKYQIKAW